VWLFKVLKVNAWSTREAVPWRGELKLGPTPGAQPKPNRQAAE
jgi:hypothetical protein